MSPNICFFFVEVRPRSSNYDSLVRPMHLLSSTKKKQMLGLMGLHVYKMEAMEGYTHNMQARGAHDVEAKH